MRCGAGHHAVRAEWPKVPTAKYLALSHSFSSEGNLHGKRYRRIHSRYLGDKAFPKDITEFEIG
jgi:hypothetical protein